MQSLSRFYKTADLNQIRERFEYSSVEPFNRERIEFLSTLSKTILSSKNLRVYPDLMAFGYFCRRKNLESMRYLASNQAGIKYYGLGHGLHICPSNLAVNFAMSYVMGYLSGNHNLIRLSSLHFQQAELLIKVIEDTWIETDLSNNEPPTYFFHSNRNDEVVEQLLTQQDFLVVWGGDATVQNFKQKTVDSLMTTVYFPNRLSVALFNSEAFLSADDRAVYTMIDGFYSDTLYVKQKACSSPSALFWLGSSDDRHKVENRFKEVLEQVLKKRSSKLSSYQVSRLNNLCKHAMHNNSNPDRYKRNEVISLFDYQDKIESLGEGIFSTYWLTSLTELPSLLKQQIQTLSFWGFSRDELIRAISKARHKPYRIVPTGHTLDMDLVWDGKNMISELTQAVRVI